jgi:hypothetical protein
MTRLLQRRDFLKASVASLGVTLVQIPAVRGQDPNTRHWVTRRDQYDGIHFYVHGLGDEFGRNKVIEWSLPILHARFRNLAVVRNVYRRLGNRGYFLGPGVWEASNLEPHPRYGPGELLWFQINHLRLPNDPNDPEDTDPPFPNVHIHPFFRRDGTWAYVEGRDVGSVVIRYNDRNRRSYQRGEFRLHVNTWHLGAVGFNERNPPRTIECDPLNWAHVIAHEMLHNLGHRHHPNEYVDTRQVNAFDHALYCNGNYPRSERVPGFT